MKSIWSESLKDDTTRHLERDLKTDILIIGGGMAGVLSAYFLHQNGVEYALIEGGKIGAGITKNTTAKITAQHGLVYDSIIKKYGVEKAQLYLRANLSAIEKYRKLCENIDCDFENKPAYVYTLSQREKIEKEISALERLRYPVEFVEKLPLPFTTKGSIKFSSQAQFNPIKFINNISNDLKIYEDTFATNINKDLVITNRGAIRAKKIIIATHFPMINLAGLYSVKMYQHRSYVLALENAPNVEGMYVDEAEKGLSFRNYEDLLLVGGGDHRTGETGGNWNELRNFVKTHYPEAKERYFWSTQDCMSLDGIPYIGRISKSYPYVYVATGFNKWGMTSSMVGAEILCDMVLEKKNEYTDTFKPNRSIFHKQLSTNVLKAAGNLLSLGGKRCSHLGCKLKWNPAEKTWDCPCHGSRYSEDGKVIDNPAKKDI